MATAKAKNIVTPKSIASSTISGATLHISEEHQRHAVVGIALVNTLVPELKNLIDTKLKVLYDKLVKKYSIDTANNSLGLHDSSQPYKEHGFNYRDPKSSNPKDFIIKDHQENMVKFMANSCFQRPILASEAWVGLLSMMWPPKRYIFVEILRIIVFF